MLVYGDIARRCAPAELLTEVRDRLRAAQTAHVLERHAALVAALITAGQLMQGVADAELETRGVDGPSTAQNALAALLLDLAVLVLVSWRSAPCGAEPPHLAQVNARVGEFEKLHLPPRITVKQPEGYAFYGLYPEAYIEAAGQLEPGEHWRVLGLRSIGTSLAAAVAAAVRAPPPITVRPVGPPFQRRLELAPGAIDETDAVRFAVVDEGPGLSGSSFGAAADALEAQGVARDHIHVFPGHAGELGPHASAAHRARWRELARHVVSFDALLVESGRLQAWAEELVGPAVGPLEDVSGGAWRAHRCSDPSGWPPSNAAQERRKFLLRARDGVWLLKFAGLGAIGEHKLERARALHAAGFSPEPAVLRHGFLV